MGGILGWEPSKRKLNFPESGVSDAIKTSLLVLNLFARINLMVFLLVRHKPKSQWPIPVIQVLQSLTFLK